MVYNRYSQLNDFITKSTDDMKRYINRLNIVRQKKKEAIENAIIYDYENEEVYLKVLLIF